MHIPDGYLSPSTYAAVSVALAIQTLFFGDGGVVAYGANALNMAFVMPLVGYGVYVAIARRAPLTSRRRAIAAGIGDYTADGTPLYAPFHRSQTLPTMAPVALLDATNLVDVHAHRHRDRVHPHRHGLDHHETECEHQ